MNKKTAIIISSIIFALLILLFSRAGNAAMTITLNSPANNTWHKSLPIEFNYTPISDNDSVILNCSLITNESSWPFLAQNDTEIENNTINTFTYNFSGSEGYFLWNVQCHLDYTEILYYANENRTVMIDYTNPSTNATLKSSDGNLYTSGTWINSEYINITLTCQDNLSGCDKIYYCTDSDNTCTPTSEYSSTFNVSGERITYVRFYSKDVAGNSEVVQNVSINIDRTYPIIDFVSPTESSGVSVSRDWVVVNVTVTELNLANLTYFLYNSSSLVNATTFSNISMVNFTGLGDGVYFYNASACDLAGNCNYTTTMNITLDTTPPVTSASGKLPDDSNYTFNTWINADYVNITLTCQDNLSGCDKIYYCTDSDNTCTPNLNYSGIIPILNESVSYVRFYSNDTLGNEESVKNITVKIDRTQPLITHIELQPELSYYGPSVSNLVLLVNFTDETSGVNFCNYTIYYPNATPYLENQDTDNDNGISGQANGTFPMPNLTGIYAINITCYDAAGLFVQNSTTFNLDLENPIAELALLPTYVNGIVEINGTANDNQNLFNYTINIINSTSGVVLTYTNDTAKNNELLHSFNSSAFENGLYTIQLIVYDSAGNYNETNITTTIDNEPPTTTCTADDLWHNSDMTIYLIAIDALSGVNVTYYCTGENCTPTNVYDNLTGIDITSEGTTAIKYYSIDNLNNAETTKNCSVKIDKTKPTTSDNVPDGWQNAPYNVTIIPQDGLSGVNYTTYCLDGNCNNVSGTLEFNIEINTSGNHTIQYFSVDNAGNIQDNVTKYAALDLNAPKINSAWLGEPDIFYSPYPENSIITIYANITDEHSGIKNVLANFSGLSCGEKNMTYNSSSGLYETSCDASYDAETKNFENVILKIIAYDNVENEQETQLLTILYNMTTFEFENPNCFRHGSLSTNFSQQLDFNSVNFIADIEMNLSCFGFDVGWMKVATLNFSTLNFSDPSIGSKLANLANAINVTPKLPRELGDARIDINTTAFAELNTNTTITLYNLPFASQPNITADNSSKQGSIRVISWEPFLMPFLYNGSLIGILGGNLTFAVEGFSGYNITENIAPTINITIPENGSLTRSPFVNITANGTGTEISKVVLTVNGTTYYYNSSVQDIECVPISEGSDIFYCAINLTSLPDGNHTINITAYDYGGTSGNSVTGSAVFELDKTAPVIIFSLSTATVYVGQTITATCTATDARDGTITPTYTVNPSTSTAGTFTTTCTATDAAGNTAISSLTYTVNNWPSGGGSSGGTGVIVPTASMIWAVLEENSEKTFNVANKDIDVTEFSLSIKKASSNVMIKIKKLGSKPSIVPELKNAYSYLEIEKTNLQEDNINRIKIKFKVSKKWLNEKGIAKQDITLNHYKNNKWNELPTTIKSEDSEFVYYEAETSSLSYFAIAQTSKPTMPTTTPTPTVTPTQIPTQTPTPTETPEQTPMKTQTPVKEGEKLSDKTSLLILVVLIVVLLLLTYLIYRKKAFV